MRSNALILFFVEKNHVISFVNQQITINMHPTNQHKSLIWKCVCENTWIFGFRGWWWNSLWNSMTTANDYNERMKPTNSTINRFKTKKKKKSFTSKSRWFVQQYQAKLIHWIKLNAKCELHNKKTKTKPKFISRAKAMHIFIRIDGGRTFIEIIPHAFYAFSEEFLSCCFRCISLYGRWFGAACSALLYGKELYPDLMKWNFNRLCFFFLN